MPCFYHYTDDEGAENIIRTGTILASVQLIAEAGAAFGNGVYLTALSPETSTKQQIAKNNWQNISYTSINKVKNYLILHIPDEDIKDTNALDRNIFLFGHRNDLRLHKYKWVLKKYDSGATVASYKYRISSSGPAARCHEDCMGDYVMIDEVVNGRPVYKGSEQFLFMSSKGSWGVGRDVGKDVARIGQVISEGQGPDKDFPWLFVDTSSSDLPWETDETLKVVPYGALVFDFDKV